MSFEVLDEELIGGSIEIQIDNDNEALYWPSENIDIQEINNDEYNFDNVFVADFLIPRKAIVKYDVDCVSHLEEDETATISIGYSFESITGNINSGSTLDFNKDTKKDDGKISVPAGIPISIAANKHTPNGSILLERATVTLEFNEEFKVNVDL